MDNSRSLEALYQDGTGMVSLPKKSYKASIEGYDGFDDILSVDLAKSEENLAFLDTYQMIEAKNAADKIKMCKKLSANYGTRSGIPTAAATSVESLCHMMSLEEAANAEAAGVNTGNEKVKTPETQEKKFKFFRTIFEKIGEFFSFIGRLFRKFVGLFQKKVVEEEKGPDATVDMNVNADKSEDSSTSTSGSTNNASLNLKKLNGRPLDIRNLKVEKLGEVINAYENNITKAKLLTKIPNANDVDGVKTYNNNTSVVRDNNAKLMARFGFKVSTSDFSVDTKKATSFDKFYKMAEKQISTSDDETYATVLKNLCNISTLDVKQWTDLASKNKMKCSDKGSLSALGKFADRFAKAADEYASISSELAKNVDSTLATRTRKTAEEGTDGKMYESRKWSRDDGAMNDIEVYISSTAAMLKFTSKIGKLVIDIYTRIVSTINAADKVHSAGAAARNASDKAARDATKTAKNI